MRRSFSLFLVLFVSLSLLTGCNGNSPKATISSDTQTGQTLYENFCLSCHGPAGKGDGPAASTLQPRPADLAALLQTHDDKYLAARISEGKEGTAMVAWKNVLSEAQIGQIVAYLRTLK